MHERKLIGRVQNRRSDNDVHLGVVDRSLIAETRTHGHADDHFFVSPVKKISLFFGLVPFLLEAVTIFLKVEEDASEM